MNTDKKQLNEAEALNASFNWEQNEEKCALASKKEGNEKLNELVDTVFFDLEDDGDTTSYSTTNSMSDVCEQGSKQQEQIHKLKKQTTETLRRLDEKRRLLGTVEEQLNRAFLEKQHSQAIPVSLQKHLDMLREDNRRAEQCNARLELKLQLTLTQCKQLNDQYGQSSELLEQKQREFDKLTKRYNALESDFEAMLLEKDVKISELKGSLELTQGRCEQLEPELVRHQEYIKLLGSRLAAVEHTNALLNSYFDGALAELDSIDDLLIKDQSRSRLSEGGALSRAERLGHLNQELRRALVEPQSMSEDFVKQLEQRDNDLRLLREQENESLEKMAALNEEKARLELQIEQMQKERGKVQESLVTNYTKLQLNISPLIAERDALRENRLKGDTQLKKLQADLLQLSEEHESLKQKCDQLKEDNGRLFTKRETADALRQELDRYRGLLVAAQAEVDRVTQLQADTTRQKDVLAYELQEQREQHAILKRGLQMEKHTLESELQALQAKSEQEKSDADAALAALAAQLSASCSKCEEKLDEMRNAELQISNLQKINKRQAKILKEHFVDVDKTKLFDVDEQMDKLKFTQQALSMQEGLLSGLKGNAEQFKAFIKQQDKGNPKQPDIPQCGEQPTPSTEQEQYRQRMEEECKCFGSQLQKANEKYQSLLDVYQKIRADLDECLAEVETLKKTLAEERAKTETIVSAKDTELTALMHKSSERGRRVLEMKNGFVDLFSNISAERQSMKTLMDKWEARQGQFKDREQLWKEKTATIIQEHQKAMMSAHQRYQTAMHTANNYKLLAEEKAKEYQESLAEMKLAMKQRLERYKKRSASLPQAPTETAQ